MMISITHGPLTPKSRILFSYRALFAYDAATIHGRARYAEKAYYLMAEERTVPLMPKLLRYKKRVKAHAGA